MEAYRPGSFGQRVKRLREKRAMTQKDLGKLVGVSQNAVWLLEQGPDHGGTDLPRPALRQRYADVLGTTVSHLMFGTEDRQKRPKPIRPETAEDRPYLHELGEKIEPVIEDEVQRRLFARLRRIAEDPAAYGDSLPDPPHPDDEPEPDDEG